MDNVFIESEECFDSLFLDLMNAFQKNSEPHIRMQKTTGKTEIQLFRVKPLKPILDKIDYLLSLSLKLSDEQYDFIINYDIKYRMGDELNSDEWNYGTSKYNTCWSSKLFADCEHACSQSAEYVLPNVI